ncbi:putative bifunctional diguanylate cyclase/phosphodiesterase [Brevibacillus migulae]|uniref:putative bifunctional diguanylate cyclase/phosphodiesterase n=1 Tax=Brevibacillus migulae TaxID=1644114 RepID=UPI0014304E32|nr:GGDEF domain-containing phosphodiesterase [Brevibacillus migulae]
MDKIDCRKFYSEARFQIISNQFNVLIDHITDAVDVVDMSGRLIKVNNAFEQMYGWKESEIIGRKLPIIPSDFLREAEHLHERAKKGGVVSGYETIRMTKEGTLIHVLLTISPLVDMKGNVCGHIGISRDITEQKKLVNELTFVDQLTKLPNRAYFRERFQAELSKGQGNQYKVALILVNLDRFSLINESFSQLASDLLLKEAANRLMISIGTEQLLARLGGDEFAILCMNISQKRDVIQLVRKILRQLQSPFLVDDREVDVTGSIGISVFPQDGQTLETLFKNAKAALNLAKRAGGNTYRFYDKEVVISKVDRYLLASELKKAVRRGELEVHYQPIVEVKQGILRGFEALVRWKHHRMGWISPVDFIPLAEETGLINPIGLWVIRKACHDMKELHLLHGVPHMVAVNLSPLQLENKQLTKQIREILRSSGLEANRLELEITESAVAQNVETAIETLKELLQMGVHISIDDFGTGYSSLSYLKRLPFHNLKIDKSFIQSGKAEDEAILNAVITMAHELHKKVVAEGVETFEQFDLLKRLHFDYFQGYLVSKPMPVGLLPHFISEHAFKITEKSDGLAGNVRELI